MNHRGDKNTASAIDQHFIPTNSEMGQLIMAKDWSKTEIGPIEEWPRSLVTALNIILNSGYPMFLWWGKSLIMFHNDAYLPVLGKKHPKALGESAKEIWSELWDQIGSVVTEVFEGKRFDAKDFLMFLGRKDFLEETYWTFSYSPFMDDDGEVGGLFCACNEESEKIIGQRRLETLNALASLTTQYTSPEEICSVLPSVIRRNPNDVIFSVFYKLETETGRATLLSKSGVRNDPGFFPQEFFIHSTSGGKESIWTNSIDKNKIRILHGLQSKFSKVVDSEWGHIDAIAVIPIQNTGKSETDGILICGISPYLEINREYRTYFNLISSQVSTILADANTYQYELKRAEELAAIDRDKTTFFSNISHEFRTPLTLILGPLEDIIAESRTSHHVIKLRDRLEVIMRNGIILQKMVNTLLDFSQIEAKRATAYFQPTEISRFTAELASNFQSSMQRAGLEYIIAVDDLQEPIYIDREMWEKIVLNLISNALKFTLEGQIEVSLKATDKEILFSVKDTGTGISKEDQKHIFKRFHRISSISRTHEGSGIGLSLVIELVKMHGGEINVISEEGKGSEFIVRIPKGKPYLPEDQISDTVDTDTAFKSNAAAYVNETLGWIMKEPTDPEEKTLSSSKKYKVLVVDDNPDMRSYLKRLLTEDFEVMIAENGKAAQEKIKKGPMPDLVLSDVMMPETDGIVLMRSVKESPETNHIPVILLSARAGDEAQIEGIDSGADDYLIKPFSSRQLMARVKAQLKIAAAKKHTALQLSNLFIQAPVGLSILRGPRHIVELANDEILKIWGKKSGEVLHEPIFEAIPDAKGQGYEQILERVYTKGERYIAYDLPLKLNHSGDEEIFLKLIYEPLREEDGTVSGIMVLADDVTEQVKIRNRAQEREIQQRFLSGATKILSETLDYDKMLKALANISVPKVGDFCILDLLTNGSEIKRVAWAVADPGKQKVFDQVLQVSSIQNSTEHPVYRAIESGETELIEHINQEWLDNLASSDYMDFLQSFNIHSMLIVPLIFGKSKLGAIKFCLSDSNRTFDKDEIYLAEELSKRVAIALHNAHLYEQAQKEISKRKRIENELSISEKRFRVMSDSVPIMIRVLDKKGACTYWNKPWYEYTGQTKRTSLGSKWMNAIHPDDVKQTEKIISSSVKKKKPFEFNYRLRNNESQYRWHMDSGLPKYSENGVFEGFIGTAVDIHERKLAEDALKESEDNLRQAIDATKLGTWNYYPETGKMIWSDRCKELFGIPTDQDVDYELFLQGLHPEDRKSVVSAIKKSLHPKHREPYEVEYRVIGFQDRKIRWHRAKGEALFNARDQAERIVGTVLDITERKFLEQQKEDFLGIASHELKTPVTSIKGNVQVLEHTLRAKGAIYEANQLEKVDRQVNKLVSLINDLLDVTKIETGKILFSYELFDFNELVDEVVKSMQFVSVHHVLKRTQGPGKAMMSGDKNRIEQVITNLISNAIKYSPNADKVIINTSIEDSVVILSVKDFGAGLSPEHMNKIFDRFYRVSGTNNNWASGLGLGLYISSEIVNNHKGKIWVESVLNEGSIFFVSLPLKTASDA